MTGPNRLKLIFLFVLITHIVSLHGQVNIDSLVYIQHKNSDKFVAYINGNNKPYTGVANEVYGSVIVREISYKNGLMDGYYVCYYYPSKNIKSKVIYRKGKKEGKYKEWNEDGTLTAIVNYRHDKKIGRQTGNIKEELVDTTYNAQKKLKYESDVIKLDIDEISDSAGNYSYFKLKITNISSHYIELDTIDWEYNGQILSNICDTVNVLDCKKEIDVVTTISLPPHEFIFTKAFVKLDTNNDSLTVICYYLDDMHQTLNNIHLNYKSHKLDHYWTAIANSIWKRYFIKKTIFLH